MSSNAPLYRILLLFLPVIGGISCTFTALDTGGSSGTEISTVDGSVVDENGSPVPGALVRLRPTSFLADSASDSGYVSQHSICDTISGPDGDFIFPDINPDNYVVEISVDDTLGASTELTIDAGHPEDTTLSPLTIAPMAMVSGNARVSYNSEIPVRVQIYGIDRSAVTDTTGDFSLQVPYGKHHLYISASPDNTSPTEEFIGVDVYCR